MKLYLVRHGEALPKDVDPDRGLSEQGAMDVARIASFLSNAGVKVSQVIHSGKRRAEQTAELLAAAVTPGKKAEAMPGLDPLYPPEGLAQKATEWNEDVMVVGHLPFMDKLVARLLTGSATPGLVAFGAASVLCLERQEAGSWKVIWMFGPELLKRS